MKTPLPEPYQFLEQDDASYTPFEAVYSEAQLRAAMVAAYNEAIEDAVDALYRSFREGPEAMETAMEKLKEQTQ